MIKGSQHRGRGIPFGYASRHIHRYITPPYAACIAYAGLICAFDRGPGLERMTMGRFRSIAPADGGFIDRPWDRLFIGLGNCDLTLALCCAEVMPPLLSRATLLVSSELNCVAV
jgi:hypothetical protein